MSLAATVGVFQKNPQSFKAQGSFQVAIAQLLDKLWIVLNPPPSNANRLNARLTDQSVTGPDSQQQGLDEEPLFHNPSNAVAGDRFHFHIPFKIAFPFLMRYIEDPPRIPLKKGDFEWFPPIHRYALLTYFLT